MTTLTAPEPDDRDPRRVPDTTGDVVDLVAARDRRTATEGPDAEDTPVVLVDSLDASRSSLLEVARQAELRPIVPVWARSRDELREALRWVVAYYGHTATFHLSRSPVYAARLAARAPRGLVRISGGVSRWVADTEGTPVRQSMARTGNAEMYLKLARQRDLRVRSRTIAALLGTGGSAAGAGLLAVAAPDAAQYAVGAALVALFGWAGSPADKPLISSPAVVDGRPPKLTSHIVVRALSSLGLAEINKAVAKGGEGISFVAPITRDGPGYRADVDLPYGVTVSDVMDRRDRLASGLRRPLGCVWPEAAHEAHAGRLVLWVGDQDLSKAPPTPWPLAKAGQVDLFAPVPVGTDPRGRTVTVTLAENNVLIGSLPGGGKTATARVYLLAAALDPTAELWVFNLKNNNDVAAAKKVAHRYAAGLDDATVETALQALRDLKDELLRRSEAIKKLPVDLCPDGKVTRALANRHGLGLHLLVAFIDECQNLFSHPVYGKEAGELAEYVIKLGRALGIILILATQRPDAASLPTGVSANVGVRFCLRVMGQTENDMILGTSMYKNGVRATTLRPSDKGIGYLVGAADDPLIVRSAYIDIPAADRIADRARAARIAAGTLGGYAAGEETPTPMGEAACLLEDIVAVVPASETNVWNQIVVERLAELRPAVYGGWEAEQLTVSLKPHGVSVGQVWGTDPATGRGANRRGITRTDITDVVTERNRKRGTG